MFISKNKLVGVFKNGYLLIYPMQYTQSWRFDLGKLESDGILFLVSAEASFYQFAIKTVCRKLQIWFS